MRPDDLVLNAFHEAAAKVPAYQQLLAEAGVDPAQITSLHAFASNVPTTDKACTFQRFAPHELVAGGTVPRPASMMCSSGASGVFAYGLTALAGDGADRSLVDDGLHVLCQVRSKPTLLVNCMPMGVKLHTEACMLGETSVRADMAVEIVRKFAPYNEQVVLAGDPCFIKHLLEHGQDERLDWRSLRVYVVTGGEQVAENARKYMEALLGTDVRTPDKGRVISSMGTVEIGLNHFSESTPTGSPPLLRRAIHESPALREAVFGAEATVVPAIFAYDPRRTFAEILDDGSLAVTTLDTNRPIPLIRYRTGDRACWPAWSDKALALLADKGVDESVFPQAPLICIHGRAGGPKDPACAVTPEQIKEGLYAQHDLAGMTTANFRLASDGTSARVRIQLRPGLSPSEPLAQRFSQAIAPYAPSPVSISCEAYEQFAGGMSLDYERKFAYLDV